MIPAFLAVPLVQGLVGSIANQFAPRPNPAAAGFATYFNKQSTTGTPLGSALPSTAVSASGTLRSSEWSQFGAAGVQTWLSGLSGHQVEATDLSGRVISGVVGNAPAGSTQSLTIGGHLVSLSQLKQVTWTPSAI